VTCSRSTSFGSTLSQREDESKTAIRGRSMARRSVTRKRSLRRMIQDA
jgi:hypothetical protein